jgi:putative oxidoreductase
MGAILQRLFSTFANGWPGFGLLLQRLVLGVVLVCHGLAALWGASLAGPVVPKFAGSVLGLFIVAGLWTPAVGTLVAVVEVWIALTVAGDRSVAMILATLGGTLAMVGPGAWSMDARLFGRKHIAG